MPLPYVFAALSNGKPLAIFKVNHVVAVSKSVQVNNNVDVHISCLAYPIVRLPESTLEDQQRLMGSMIESMKKRYASDVYILYDSDNSIKVAFNQESIVCVMKDNPGFGVNVYLKHGSSCYLPCKSEEEQGNLMMKLGQIMNDCK